MNQQSVEQESDSASVLLNEHLPSVDRLDADRATGSFGRLSSTWFRHRALVSCCLGTVALVTLVLGLASPPVYRTMVSVTPPTTGSDSTGRPFALPQKAILFSSAKDRLIKERHSYPVASNDLLSKIRRLLHKGGTSTPSSAELITEAANASRLKSTGPAQPIKITCNSRSPDLAVEFCSSLAAELIRENASLPSAQALLTAGWLSSKIEGERLELDQVVKHLELERSRMASQPASKLTGNEARLLALSQDLIAARNERLQNIVLAAETSATLSDAFALLHANDTTAFVAPAVEGSKPLPGDSSSQPPVSSEVASAGHREDLLRIAFNAEGAKVAATLRLTAEILCLQQALAFDEHMAESLQSKSNESSAGAATQVLSPPRSVFPMTRLLGLASSLFFASLLGLTLLLQREKSTMIPEVEENESVDRFMELGAIPDAKLLLSPYLPYTSSVESKRPSRPFNPSVIPWNDEAALTRWIESFSIAALNLRRLVPSASTDSTQATGTSYLITSSNPGAGRTNIAAGLGVALSQAGLRVLIIDADYKRAGLHTFFNVGNSNGLGDLLESSFRIQDAPVEYLFTRTALARLAIIPAGQYLSSSALSQQTRLLALFARLKAQFEVILVDAPSMLEIESAHLLGVATDAAILVIPTEPDERKRTDAIGARLKIAGVRRIATILNKLQAI